MGGLRDQAGRTGVRGVPGGGPTVNARLRVAAYLTVFWLLSLARVGCQNRQKATGLAWLLLCVGKWGNLCLIQEVAPTLTLNGAKWGPCSLRGVEESPGGDSGGLRGCAAFHFITPHWRRAPRWLWETLRCRARARCAVCSGWEAQPRSVQLRWRRAAPDRTVFRPCPCV